MRPGRGNDMRWSLVALLALISPSALALETEVQAEGGPAQHQSADSDNPETDEVELIRPGGNELEWARREPEPVPRAGVEPRGFAARGMGIRGMVHRTQGPGRRAAPGFMAYERGIGVLSGAFVTGRYFDELWIGYDGLDVTYSLSVQGAFGVFWPIRAHHGPLARISLRGDLRQQGGWSLAQLRLPGAQLGWTYSLGVTQFEALVHASPALLGHVDSGAGRRQLQGMSYGGSLSLAWQDLRLDLDVSEVAPVADLGSMTDIRGHLCGLLGKGPVRPTTSTRGPSPPVYSGPAAHDFKASVCTDISILSTILMDASGQPHSNPSTQAVIGISVLIGRFTRLDPPREL